MKNHGSGIDNMSVISYGKIVIKAYKSEQGNVPYKKWIFSIKDKAVSTNITRRIQRIQWGNPGNFKAFSGGICELKLNFGPGYRIYYGMDGKTMIILLHGGDKSTQRKDIEKAKTYWQDYKENKNERTSDI